MMLICDLWQLLYILCLIFINLGDAVMVISVLSWVAAVVLGVGSQLQPLKYKYVFVLQYSTLQNHHITNIPPFKPIIPMYLLSQEKSGLFLLFFFFVWNWLSRDQHHHYINNLMILLKNFIRFEISSKLDLVWSRDKEWQNTITIF